MIEWGIKLHDKIIRIGFSEDQARDFVRVKIQDGYIGYSVVKRSIGEWTT